MKIDTADKTIRFYIGDLLVKNAQLEETIISLRAENEDLKVKIESKEDRDNASER